MRSDAGRNHEALVRAATRAAHANGLSAPMAAIAEQAGVSVATMYRHFASREELLDYLTQRSFEALLHAATAAAAQELDAAQCLRTFLCAVIDRRTELVLPLHGGPAIASAATRALRDDLQQVIGAMIDRGHADGTIVRDVTAADIAALGATLAQPRSPHDRWDEASRRLLDTYLAGLGVPRSGAADRVAD